MPRRFASALIFLLLPLIAGCAALIPRPDPEAERLMAVFLARQAVITQASALINIQMTPPGKLDLPAAFTAVLDEKNRHLRMSAMDIFGAELFRIETDRGGSARVVGAHAPAGAGPLLSELHHLMDGVLGVPADTRKLRRRGDLWEGESGGHTVRFRVQGDTVREVRLIGPLGGVYATVAFSDFRDQGGVRAPYRITLAHAGLGVALEAVVDEWRFTPAAPGKETPLVP